MKNLSILISLSILFSGCSSLPFNIPGVTGAEPAAATSAPQVEKPTETSVPVAQATPAPTIPAIPQNDPVEAVTIFLDGQKTGAPFALTSNLLSSTLAANVKDDSALKSLMGSPKEIGDFKVGSPSYSEESKKSALEVTMYTPDPVNMRFSLVIENGEWKIQEITVLTDFAYPTTPEAVVLSFLTTYQEAPDRMSNFLTAHRRASQPPGGAAAMLQIKGGLEGMVIQSAAVNPEPPSASIKVVIRAGGEDFHRTFLLTKENTTWGIDAIEITES